MEIAGGEICKSVVDEYPTEKMQLTFEFSLEKCEALLGAQFSEEKIGTKQEVYLKKAIYLLESFRDGSLKPSEVFDTDQLAKVMAIRAIIGSAEFDWMDTKFYYNPTTSLLEPISKEAHVDLTTNFEKHYFSWWIDSSKIRSFYIKNTNFFLDILYSDKKFY